MATLKTATIAAVWLAGGTSLAMAQNGLPTGGYGYGYSAAPLYDYATPVADLAPSAYGYAAPTPLYAAPAAPLYNYAAPAYAAPATTGTTVIIVTPGATPAYTAPYAAPSTVVSQPIYAYAPGYGYGYTPGYWNRGYWGHWRRW